MIAEIARVSKGKCVMLRFVVLEHDWPTLHWDLLLEAGAVLQAWRLRQEPSAIGPVIAEPNFDHRRIYLDYEGPVSGDRGTVRAWDRGDYVRQDVSPDQLRLELRGQRLRGVATLSREGELWRFELTRPEVSTPS